MKNNLTIPKNAHIVALVVVVIDNVAAMAVCVHV